MNKINHFYISYPGNKRKEICKLYDKLNFDDIEFIIEPFSGSCAISCYIAMINPKKYKYILNDINHYFKEMNDILTNEEKLINFENEINKELENLTDKTYYNEYVKKKDIYGWFIKNKYYRIRPGLFHMKDNLKKIDLKKCLIYHFFNNEDIEYSSIDAITVYEKYCNKSNSMIFLDPPYLNSCLTLYSNIVNPLNIYEYLFNNKISNNEAKIYLILENNWIIKLLFQNEDKYEYDKKYSVNFAIKTEVKHILIYNKNL
jgi:hypothetical protein